MVQELRIHFDPVSEISKHLAYKHTKYLSSAAPHAHEHVGIDLSTGFAAEDYEKDHSFSSPGHIFPGSHSSSLEYNKYILWPAIIFCLLPYTKTKN